MVSGRPAGFGRGEGGFAVAAAVGQDRVALVFRKGQDVRPHLMSQELHQFDILETRSKTVQIEQRAALVDHVLEPLPQHCAMARVVRIDVDDSVPSPVRANGQMARSRADAQLPAGLIELLRQGGPVGFHLGR